MSNRITTAFVERNLQLQGNRLPNARFDPTFGFEFSFNQDGTVKDNKVGVTIWTGIPGEDGRQSPLKMQMEAYTFSQLVVYAERASSMEAGTESLGLKVLGVRKRKPGDQSKDIPKGPDGMVFVGKDKDGVCYIGVVARAIDRMKFPFRPSNWTQYVDVRSGEPATLAMISCDHSEAWARFVLPVATQILIEHPFDYKAAKEAKEQANGGGGYQGGNRGNQNNGGNRGGYQEKQGGDDFVSGDSYSAGGLDDDIPF